MNDDGYEYRIARNGRTVEVRDKSNHKWRHYMTCDSESEAERILFMLQHPEFEGMVRP